jgi:hypothetical protein
MKKTVYVTTIKHDYDIEPETIVTKRPFTKEEKKNIAQNIEVFKSKNEDWEGDQTALMDYAVFKPFKTILVETSYDGIDTLKY